jgi:hypothetical protein
MGTLGINGLTTPAQPKPDDGVAQRLIANLNNSEKGILHHCYAYAWAVVQGAGGKGNSTAPKDQSAMGKPIGYLDTMIQAGSLHVGDVIYVNKQPGADPASINLAYGPHWFVYMGNGQFADQYGIKQNAAAMNAFVPGREIDSIFHCFNGSPADPPPGALAGSANVSVPHGVNSSHFGGGGSASSLGLPGGSAGSSSTSAPNSGSGVSAPADPPPPITAASNPASPPNNVAQDGANRAETADALGYDSSQMALIWNLLGPLIAELSPEERKKKLEKLKEALKGVDLTDPAALKAVIATLTTTTPVASAPGKPGNPGDPEIQGAPATVSTSTTVSSPPTPVASAPPAGAGASASVAIAK